MSRKIKILYTIPNFDTAGSGKVVYDLVKGLDKSIFAPEICVFHSKGAFFKEIEKLNIPIHVFQFTTEYKPYRTFFFRVWKISRFFKKHEFHLIHSWHWSSDFSEPMAAKLAGIPFVYTKKAMSWGNKPWIWRSQLSSKVIYINNDMGTQFFSKMKTKALQIALGVDTQEYKPRNKEVPEGLNIKKGDFVIVSIANLVPVKGIEDLLLAVKQLNDENIKTFIVGNNENDYGQDLIQNYQDQNICFLGKRTDIRPYLAMADLFVIPTKNEGRKEGMPVAPLEAMAMGIPVIGSRISGITDILSHYPNNLFEAGNSDEIKSKILEIRSLNSNERLSLKKSIRKNVEDHFSLNLFIAAHEKFYLNLKTKPSVE
ncbi:glycosyltransferase [uncultured Algibacter sp.]|uniref:glycosyltransferase n=1 Tax=uncultured Algibacter sp. TaxID=298659 RepID=UPI002622C082|nr:glycosyltransferase [uncultured Algibacter sp.]